MVGLKTYGDMTAFGLKDVAYKSSPYILIADSITTKKVAQNLLLFQIRGSKTYFFRVLVIFCKVNSITLSFWRTKSIIEG
jgi:hypothetical protein